MHEFGEPELHLERADPILGRFLREFGPCDLRLRRYEGSLFQVLANSILSQQISTKAADSIRGRFVARYGENDAYPEPARIVGQTPEELREIGISRQKASYILGLAEAIVAGHHTIEELGEMEDEEVVAALLPLKGVGRWTVEMLLIFRLGRPNVFPVDDLGVRNGMKTLYGLEEIPKPPQMREIAAAWEPYRSYGAWYMWRALGWQPGTEDATTQAASSEASTSESLDPLAKA